MMLEENSSVDNVDVSINPEYSTQVINEMPVTMDRNFNFCNSIPNCERLNDTSLSSSVSRSDACSPVDHSSKATTRKRKSVEYKNELLKIVKASCRWLEEFSDERDDCFYFGMQITNRLRRLPADVRAKVQVDILSLINEYEFAS
ncbi:uncharacterized protein LOC111612742 [Centruroides sculpturatus]|uniref:uncharacterized protein LOC111612742 n=1 Tax=Centruroides sculpturatus TaxID=218467 RepID=UPI000C6E6AAA|nr:uncharacterized protein LOC111612742 [Centruroides sculpturatus]